MVNFLVIGEVFLDLYLDYGIERLGGIFHSIRGFIACNERPAVYCICPSFLEKQVYDFFRQNNIQSFLIETQNLLPNILLVRHSLELHDHGYLVPLRSNNFNFKIDIEKLRQFVKENEITDLLIFPGYYNYVEIINAIVADVPSIRIHIDGHYDFTMKELNKICCKVQTLFLSTSSFFFREAYNNNKSFNALKDEVNEIVLKENRGGSRLFKHNKVIHGFSYLHSILHSVGIGDCYNSVFLYCRYSKSFNELQSLNYASHVARIYGATFSDAQFYNFAKRLLDQKPTVIESLKGISLPWEARQNYQIYIAAPDFENVPKEPLERLVSALEYHNFKFIRPVELFGQVNQNDIHQKKAIYCKDVHALKSSKLVIAVLLYNDQGTLVEIGMAKALNIPIIVYDPYNLVNNMFLENSVDFVSSNLDEILNKTYYLISRQYNENRSKQ